MTDEVFSELDPLPKFIYVNNSINIRFTKYTNKLAIQAIFPATVRNFPDLIVNGNY